MLQLRQLLRVRVRVKRSKGKDLHGMWVKKGTYLMNMNESLWKTLRWFKEDEFPEPYLMDAWLMKLLDEMRDQVGKRFIVHYSTDGEHSVGSAHYRGEAVDGHFEGMDVVSQYLIAEQFNFPGLGFYPPGTWNNPGLHIDTRRQEPFSKGARWWRDANGFYVPITPAAIRRFIESAGS